MRVGYPNRQALIKIYNHYEDLLRVLPASSHNHQTWKGGLKDHLTDMMRIGWMNFRTHEAFYRILGYTWEDFVTAVMCHDAEKFVVYGPQDDPRCAPFLPQTWQEFQAHAIQSSAFSERQQKEAIKWEVLKHWETEFGLNLTHTLRKAIKYAHGEGDDSRSDQRVMSQLAAALHIADTYSARIGYNDGKGLG